MNILPLLWILTLFVPDGTTVVLRYDTMEECQQSGDSSIAPRYLCEKEE